MPALRGSLILAACAIALGQAPRVVRLKWPIDAPVDAVQYTVNALSPDELASMAGFFADMPLDAYLDTVSRTRRFGKYMVDGLYSSHPKLEFKGSTFVQTGTYNELVRSGKMALVRHYAPHPPELFETKGLQRLLEHLVSSMRSMDADPDVPWEFCIHAIRLTPPGQVTPEGIHRDGYHFVLSAVVSRLGVEGGHSLVHSGKKEAPMLDVPMAAGDTLFINDRAVYHSVTNVSAVPSVEEGGHRDVIIITLRPWPTDAAGELVDDVALAQLSLLEGTLEVPAPEEDSVATS